MKPTTTKGLVIACHCDLVRSKARQTSVETAGLELTEQMNELYVSLLCNYNPKARLHRYC